VAALSIIYNRIAIHLVSESLLVVCAQVKKQTALLQNDPVIRRAVEARHPYIDPLNLLQVP